MTRNRLQFEQIYPDYFVDVFRDVGLNYSNSQWQMGELYQIALNQLNTAKSETVHALRLGTYKVNDKILAYTSSDLKRDCARLFGVTVARLNQILAVVDFFDADTVENCRILPFSHFEFAASLGPKAYEVLAHDMLITEKRGGKPPSVEELYMRFCVGNPEQALEDHSALNDLEQAGYEIVSQQENQEQPQEINRALLYLAKSAKRFLQSLEARVADLEIESENRNQVLELINGLSELTDLIESEFATEKVS